MSEMTWLDEADAISAEASKRRLAHATAAAEPLWEYLSGALTPAEYAGRKALVAHVLDRAGEDRKAVEASLDARYATLHKERLAEQVQQAAAQQVALALRVQAGLPASGKFDTVAEAVAHSVETSGGKRGANLRDLAYLMQISTDSAKTKAEAAISSGAVTNKGTEGQYNLFPAGSTAAKKTALYSPDEVCRVCTHTWGSHDGLSGCRICATSQQMSDPDHQFQPTNPEAEHTVGEDYEHFMSSRRVANWLDAARKAQSHAMVTVDPETGAEIDTPWRGDEVDPNGAGVLLDPTTANMLLTIHDALSPDKAAQFAEMSILKAVTVGWKLVSKTSAKTAAFPTPNPSAAGEWSADYWGGYQHGETGQIIYMYRKGQKVRFYGEDGQQVGSEHSNVAPAVAWALANGYHNPDLAGLGPIGGPKTSANAPDSGQKCPSCGQYEAHWVETGETDEDGEPKHALSCDNCDYGIEHVEREASRRVASIDIAALRAVAHDVWDEIPDRRSCGCPWEYHLSDCPILTGRGDSFGFRIDEFAEGKPETDNNRVGREFANSDILRVTKVGSAKTAEISGWWPQTRDSEMFPGEKTLACPKCGGAVVMQGVHGPGGRLGDPGGGTLLKCTDCGNSQYFPSEPRRAAKTAEQSSYDVGYANGRRDRESGNDPGAMDLGLSDEQSPYLQGYWDGYALRPNQTELTYADTTIYASKHAELTEEPTDPAVCPWQTGYGLPGMTFCGKPKSPGQPYCDEHMQDAREDYGWRANKHAILHTAATLNWTQAGEQWVADTETHTFTVTPDGQNWRWRIFVKNWRGNLNMAIVNGSATSADAAKDAAEGYGKVGGSVAASRLPFAEADRTGPTIDSPDGVEYTPAPDWVSRACRARFEGGGTTAVDPKRPGWYLHGVENFWDGPSSVKDNGDHTLSYTNPYTGETDRFDETGYYDRNGVHQRRTYSRTAGWTPEQEAGFERIRQSTDHSVLLRMTDQNARMKQRLPADDPSIPMLEEQDRIAHERLRELQGSKQANYADDWDRAGWYKERLNVTYTDGTRVKEGDRIRYHQAPGGLLETSSTSDWKYGTAILIESPVSGVKEMVMEGDEPDSWGGGRKPHYNLYGHVIERAAKTAKTAAEVSLHWKQVIDAGISREDLIANVPAHEMNSALAYWTKQQKTSSRTAAINWKGDTHMGVGFLSGVAPNGDIYEVYSNPNMNPTPCSWVNYGTAGDTGPNSGIAQGRGFATMADAVADAEAHAASKTSALGPPQGYQPTGEVTHLPCDTCGTPVAFQTWETHPGGFTTLHPVENGAGSDYMGIWCPVHAPARHSSAISVADLIEAEAALEAADGDIEKAAAFFPKTKVPDSMHQGVPPAVQNLDQRRQLENTDAADMERRKTQYWDAHPEEKARHQQQNPVTAGHPDFPHGVPYACEVCGNSRNATACSYCDYELEQKGQRTGPSPLDYLMHRLFPSGAYATKIATTREAAMSRTVPCPKCGGGLRGSWVGVECDTCSHQIDPIRDLSLLEPGEAYRMNSNGLLIAVPFVPSQRGESQNSSVAGLDGQIRQAALRIAEEQGHTPAPSAGDRSNLMGGEQRSDADYAATPRTTRPRVAPSAKPGTEFPDTHNVQVTPEGFDITKVHDIQQSFTLPSFDQIVSAKVARMARQVLVDNPHLDEAEAQRIAATAVAEYPSMVRATR